MLSAISLCCSSARSSAEGRPFGAAGAPPAPLFERRFQTLAQGVQAHPALAVAHLAQRQLQLARAPEKAHAQLLELFE
jgi:hypothetical protein